jgi:pimeloyl-ACP methyl ester carboxylesterase
MSVAAISFRALAWRRRLWPRLMLLLLPWLMSGCSLLMPPEIVEMESRTSAEALKLQRDDPAAFLTYKVGDRPMSYVDVGRGPDTPLVVFIHGSPGDWRGWADYLVDPELTQRAELVAVDRPGFGGSGAGAVERSLEQQARDISPLLDKVTGGRRVVLVGHSFGGPLAARLAMDNGSKVTDLVILAGSIDPAMEHTAWYQYPADWPPITWMLPDVLLVTNREIRALKDELVAMLPLWPRVTQRVTVMQGGKDDLVPPENADFAQKMLTHATSVNIVRIPEMNHFLPWTRYGQVKAVILEHLQ